MIMIIIKTIIIIMIWQINYTLYYQFIFFPELMHYFSMLLEHWHSLQLNFPSMYRNEYVFVIYALSFRKKVHKNRYIRPVFIIHAISCELKSVRLGKILCEI